MDAAAELCLPQWETRLMLKRVLVAAVLVAGWSSVAWSADEKAPEAVKPAGAGEVAELPVASTPPPASVAPAVTAGPLSVSPEASKETSPATEAAAASAEAKPSQETASERPSSLSDPVPDESKPDPLTPAAVDAGPAIAPGAPAQPVEARDAAVVDPFVAVVRTALGGWTEARGQADLADLAALKGFYAETGAAALWTGADGLSVRGVAAVAALKRSDTQGLEADAFVVPPTPAPGAGAQVRAEAEIRIGLAVLKYARHARGGRVEPTSISHMIDLKPRLYDPRSVLAAVAAAPAADVYLENLNPRHAGFVALREALAKLRASSDGSSRASGSGTGRTSDAERRIIVNMERWRWLPEELGPFYVWDNVPEQVTRVFHDGKVVLKERIVVGKPGTPTPMFTAPMRFVIFHPSWGVPEGIKSNELGPMLRRAQANSSGFFFSENDGASRALRRHELRAYRGGREVNPDSINWSSADVRQFHFTQGPSARNVLGIVKFRFPNKFDVYMHDTPERSLFSRASRTFSHGCMRVENPLRLAETILAYDQGWTADKVAAAARRGSTTDVALQKNVPVYIMYFTATVDGSGQLHHHPDVYGLDGRVASALSGRSVTLSSAAAPPEKQPHASSAVQRHEKRRPARQQPEPRRQTVGGRPFDPFAGN